MQKYEITASLIAVPKVVRQLRNLIFLCPKGDYRAFAVTLDPLPDAVYTEARPAVRIRAGDLAVGNFHPFRPPSRTFSDGGLHKYTKQMHIF